MTSAYDLRALLWE